MLQTSYQIVLHDVFQKGVMSMNNRILLLGATLLCFQNASLMAMDEKPLTKIYRLKTHPSLVDQQQKECDEQIEILQKKRNLHEKKIKLFQKAQQIINIYQEYEQQTWQECEFASTSALVVPGFTNVYQKNAEYEEQFYQSSFEYVQNYVQRLTERIEGTPEDEATKVEKLKLKQQRANEILQGDAMVLLIFLRELEHKVLKQYLDVSDQLLRLEYSTNQ
jgi:hypothetical protein